MVLAGVVNDGLHGWRTLRRSPRFLALSIVVIAIGAAINLFGLQLLHATSSTRLEFGRRKNIVLLEDTRRPARFLSSDDVEAVRRAARSLSQIAAYRTGLYGRSALTLAAGNDRAVGYALDPRLLSLFGVSPEIC